MRLPTLTPVCSTPKAALLLAALLSSSVTLAAPVQLNYTAQFDTCAGTGCTTAIAQSSWAAVSGTYVFDPALSTGTNAPPNGYVPSNFNTNLVHSFTGLDSFRATLNAGSVHARSTGLAFSPSPSSAYNGVAPGSGAAVVVNGDTGRLNDRLQLIDQSMNDITGLPPGWQVGPGLYGGGVLGRLALTFVWGITDPALNGTTIPQDIDSVPGTLALQAINFGFFWNLNGGPDTFVSYSGRLTSFSTQPYVPNTQEPTPGLPEPGTLALAALALGTARWVGLPRPGRAAARARKNSATVPGHESERSAHTDLSKLRLGLGRQADPFLPGLRPGNADPAPRRQ